MHPLELPEILINIFDIGSELSLDDHRGSSAYTVDPYWRPRTLKPFFKAVIQVRKQWHDLALARPSSWVTKIVLREDQFDGDPQAEGPEQHPVRGIDYPQAEQLLATSNGSVIDFYAILGVQVRRPYVVIGSQVIPQVEKDVGTLTQWINAHIFPVSIRVRQIGIQAPLKLASIKMILESTQAHQWPRLRALTFNPENLLEVSHVTIPHFPGLRYASFHRIRWDDHQNSLSDPCLSSLYISGGPSQAAMESYLSALQRFSS